MSLKERFSSAMALEFVSIVVGVLLALALSEWAQDRENTRLAETAIANIHSEIAANLATLELIHENNAATVEAISDEDDRNDDGTFIPGIQLQDTAWNTFLTTGLSAYVDYDTVLELSSVYSIQNVYKQTGRQLIEATMTATAFAAASGEAIDDDHFTRQFAEFLQMLVAIEQQLLDAYGGATAASASRGE